MATNNQGSRAAREAAAEARAQAKAQQNKRERTIQIIGGAVVLTVVAVLVFIGVKAANKTAGGIDTTAALPKGVASDTYGVKVGTAWKLPNAKSIPKLEIWEDFQCPACAYMESRSGSAIAALAKVGKVRVEYRPTIFLDENLVAENTASGNPKSSLLATMAYGCAVDAGKGQEFHKTVFANQPQEGKGYSVGVLNNYAQSSGIADQKLFTFNDCLTAKKYAGWVNNSYTKFRGAGITTTPTGVLNGKALENTVLTDPVALTKAIKAATK
jgi:protein-disulfide isomerase